MKGEGRGDRRASGHYTNMKDEEAMQGGTSSSSSSFSTPSSSSSSFSSSPSSSSSSSRYDEPQYLADIEEHLGVTIQQAKADMKVAADEFDGEMLQPGENPTTVEI